MAKMNGHADRVVTPEAITMLEAYAREKLPLDSIGERTGWRDRAIASLRDLKARTT